MGMFSMWVRLGVGLGVGLGVAGCALEASEETTSQTQAAMTRYPTAFPADTTYGFQWTFHDYGTASYLFPGLPDPNLVGCALVSVGGKFVNANDKMRIIWGSTSGWGAKGQSGGGDPGLDAMCFQLNGAELSVDQILDPAGGLPGPIPLKIGTRAAVSTDTCFLTGIKGVFNSFADNMVRLSINSGGQWQLDGATGIAAWARCVSRPTDGAEATWHSYDRGLVMPPGTLTGEGSSGPHFCGLTRIHGTLGGGWSGTYVNPLPDDTTSWNYYLGGGANPFSLTPKPIGTSARCIH